MHWPRSTGVSHAWPGISAREELIRFKSRRSRKVQNKTMASAPFLRFWGPCGSKTSLPAAKGQAHGRRRNAGPTLTSSLTMNHADGYNRASEQELVQGFQSPGA